jgi:hypothetical protein
MQGHHHNAIVDPNPKLAIPCKVCSVSEGVPQLDSGISKCTRCAAGMYQLSVNEIFLMHVSTSKQNVNDEVTRLVVGVSCQHCPAGMAAQKSAQTGYWQNDQCRGSQDEC